MISSRILTAALALLVMVSVAACEDDSPSSAAQRTQSLPRAQQLLDAAAQSMSEIQSAHVTLRVKGENSGLPVQRLEGDLTREGGTIAAKGTGKMRVMGQLVSVEFVLTGGTLYVKGPTGGYQQIPQALSSAVYDPSAILDPQRGISKILRSVRDPQTVARAEVNGTQTFQVTGTVGTGALDGLLPGIAARTDVTFWLAEAQGHRPVKAAVTLPAGKGDPATAVVTLSQINKPVTVEPPA